MAPRNSPRVQDAEVAILRSARHEIETQGILGLRVAEVAAGAGCSITQIYRYFGDRDGLLARVLGDYYEESISAAFNGYMDEMRALPVITVDDIVNSLPTPSAYANMKGQEIRLQILAVSVTNTQLRERIERTSQDHITLWEEGLDFVESRLEKGVRLDRRLFTIMLLVQNMYYRTLLGGRGFTDDEYQQFLRDKLVIR